MIILLNQDQKKSLSSFFNNVAVAWFVVTFITPAIKPEIGLLTFLVYIVNIIGNIYLSLYLLGKE